VPAKTIAALTRIPAVYFDFAGIPGLKPPSLPKGETECKALGSTTSGGRFVALTTTITVLSGPSRTAIDEAWPQMIPVGRVVTGVGDVAVFDSATMSLVGYRGGFAFSVTLEPFPLTHYTSARVLVIETALAKVLVSHLG
jgi:hypothetical protein